jgi:cytochrome c oxidase subunit 2
MKRGKWQKPPHKVWGICHTETFLSFVYSARDDIPSSALSDSASATALTMFMMYFASLCKPVEPCALRAFGIWFAPYCHDFTMPPGVPLFPERASTVAGQVDALYAFLVAVSVFFSLLIAGLIVYFAVKFRRRTDDQMGEPITGALSLEIIWTIIPFLITMAMFVWGVRVYFTLYTPPEQALEINVLGRQWMWEFRHGTGQREINQLHVPVGSPVKLIMASQDVIHSLFVPAFRVKADVVPGTYRTLWFEVSKPGEYHLFCAEYCGTQHSGMIGKVVALEPTQYQAWLSGTLSADGGADESPTAAGEKLFVDLACHTCHRPDRQGIGPMLAGLLGTRVRLRDGSAVVADENYIRESILHPTAKVVAGFEPVMPPYQGRVNELQLLQLIAYIKSLAPQTAAAAVMPPQGQSAVTLPGEIPPGAAVAPPVPAPQLPPAEREGPS